MGEDRSEEITELLKAWSAGETAALDRLTDLAGSAVVTTGSVGPSLSCVKGVQLSDGGTFRFDVRHVLGENFCQLKVYKGAAAVQMPSFIWVLTPGRAISLNPFCGDHTPRSEFGVTETDALDHWSQTRSTSESGHAEVRPKPAADASNPLRE